MLALTRKNRIRDIIGEQKSVTVIELADKFKVTEETIRRDLKSLEDSGVLIRTYGGAYLNEESFYTGKPNPVSEISNERLEKLCEHCLDLIDDGDSLMLDSSQEALCLCGKLKNKRLNVITDSLLVASALADCEGIQVISTGGYYNKETSSFTGKVAQQVLSGYYADKVFLSCTSLDTEFGISERHEDVAAMRLLMTSRAKTVYLLADHDKFGEVSLFSVCGFDRIHAVATHCGLSSDWQDFFVENDIELIECPAFL